MTFKEFIRHAHDNDEEIAIIKEAIMFNIFEWCIIAGVVSFIVITSLFIIPFIVFVIQYIVIGGITLHIIYNKYYKNK